MSTIEGHWVQDEAFSNMEGILDAVGMTDPQIRGMILSIKPELELRDAGAGQWEYRLVTPHTTRTVTFSSGQEVDYVSIVGRPVKAVLTVGDSRLEEVHRDPSSSGLTTYITRVIDGDAMHVTMKVNDVECVGKYKRA